jgi:hypothetical protein
MSSHSGSLSTILIVAIVILAVVSIGLHSAEKSFHVKDWVLTWIQKSPYPELPSINLQMVNSTRTPVCVRIEGEFFILTDWMGYSGKLRAIPGKYSMTEISKSGVINGIFMIKPAHNIRTMVQLKQPRYLAQYLNKANTYVSLKVRLNNGSSFFTEDIPFTKETIEKYSYTIDLGKKGQGAQTNALADPLFTNSNHQ